MTADRFSRQKLIPWIGVSGQRQLGMSHAAVVGVGAVGCVAADALVRAGVGSLTLIDRDVVDHTNLHRQCLYTEADAAAATPKAEAARARLALANSGAEIRAEIADLSPSSVRGLLADACVVLDCTDNYETRYLLNDYCVQDRLPLCYAGAIRSQAMAITVLPGVSACLRCVFSEPVPLERRDTCDTVGVLGPAATIAGSLAATDAIKILSGRSDLMNQTLRRLDLETGAISAATLAGARDPDCPCCAHGKYEFLNGARAHQTTALCGRDAIQIASSQQRPIDLRAIADRLRAHGEVHATRFLVRADLLEERRSDGSPVQMTVFADGRTVIEGETLPERARSLVARYLGA